MIKSINYTILCDFPKNSSTWFRIYRKIYVYFKSDFTLLDFKSFIGKYFPTKFHCTQFWKAKGVGGYMRGVAPTKDEKNPKYFLDDKLIIDSNSSNFRVNFSIKSIINNTL